MGTRPASGTQAYKQAKPSLTGNKTPSPQDWSLGEVVVAQSVRRLLYEHKDQTRVKLPGVVAIPVLRGQTESQANQPGPGS